MFVPTEVRATLFVAGNWREMSQLPLPSQQMPERAPQFPLPSQRMPEREPHLALSSGDDDSDGVEIIEPPRLGVPMTHAHKRAAVLEKDAIFGQFWTDRKAATEALAEHSTAQGRRSSPRPLEKAVYAVSCDVM